MDGDVDVGNEPGGPPASGTRRSVGFLTPPGLRTGGQLKTDPEDFIVEEIPAYLPGGSGEHLYLWLEKRDVGADLLLDRLARQLNCSRGDIGTAGIKDRRAVTRQWVSVPGRCEPSLAALAIDGVRVLDVSRHGNKLRTGHLKGNRFEIRLRGVANTASADPIAESLRKRGVPNLYGDQRFGNDDSTLTLGLQLLRGEKSPRSIPFARRKFLLRLALSAVQSALFNDILARRLESGSLEKVCVGDVLQVTASGGVFVAEDATTEQPRCDAGETVITGPMFGPKMKCPVGDALDMERAVLADWGLEPAVFERFADLTSGTRRPLLVRVDDLATQNDGSDLLLRFTLPAGAYATSVLREFVKSTVEAGLSPS